MMWLVLFILSFIVVAYRRLIRIPRRPKLLHTPYARPGPWHILKLISGRIWLAWRLVRHPRVLNIYDPTSARYEKVGIVASELENVWERPHKLGNREATDGIFVQGTDGGGTLLKIHLNRHINRQAEVSFLFILPNGTTYQLPGAPDTLISNTSGAESFSAAGVKFHLIEAMRKWRITFNGLAKQTLATGEESTVHFKLNVIWTAFSRPFEFKREFSRKLLAKGMARELWRGRKDWKSMSEPLFNGVDQWGVISGTYLEPGQTEEKEIYLRGLRQRRWGQSNPTTLHRKLDIIGVCEDGNYFYLSATSDSSRLTHQVWGHVYHPNGFLYKINACNLDLEKLGENGPMPRHFSLRFTAKRKNYHAIIHLMPFQFPLYHGRPWHHKSMVYPCHLTLNSRQGRVLFIATNTFHGHCPLEMEVSVPHLREPERPYTSTERDKLVLLFKEETCRYEELVGGKGASLALLSSLKNLETGVDFCVPPGFCVTVASWRKQIDGSKDLQLALKQLNNVATGIIDGNTEEVCEKASALLAATEVDPLIMECVKEALQELYGEEFESKMFAVRSSAVGEDSEDLSSAGQNLTVLGCKGLDSIINGLRQCWSSLLKFQSVEYRRQHGEPLTPGMGVVIQEMVPSEAAGVLFTVDPVDGNPGRMCVTANYGLGESVVSGKAEPDTVILARTWTGQVTVVERTLGSKEMKILLKETGTEELQTDSQQANTLCLSDEVAVQLGELGVYLEKAYGGPRDLEFALVGSQIYLLQARPVTSLDAWTDYELKHEFDTPILTDLDYETKANTGEVVPGAGTPLSLSTNTRILELNFQVTIKKQYGRLFEINPWFTGRFFPLYQNHLFINVVDSFLRDVDEEISDVNRAVDMAVFGHIIITPAIHRIGVQRFGVAGLRVKFHRYRTMLQDLFFNNSRVKHAITKYGNYTIDLNEFSNASHLYDELCRRLPDYLEIGKIHTLSSRASTLTQLITFIIILDGRKEWTTELYAELAQLFTCINDVESADVPVSLKELAKVIADSEESQNFIKNTPSTSTAWLQNDTGPSGRLFRQFLDRHGHRCYKEFDFCVRPWSLDPEKLVSILQVMVANPTSLTTVQNQLNHNQWMDDIRATKPNKYRALKFFLPRCREAVIYREKTKSLLIRVVHQFRLAYRRLAQFLVHEGKIPDPELIFFFTHLEIEKLIFSKEGHSLISKAIRRRRLYPEMDALEFPEMNLGIPKPVAENAEDSGSSSSVEGFQLCATPVCKGVVRGRARVTLNVEEARHIQCGEILITRSTDIGWSPYFPLLSGVVTELGGLISHGAVVAREYGLPCIVGAQRATQLFKTGETVVLDGAKGTLTRIIEDS